MTNTSGKVGVPGGAPRNQQWQYAGICGPYIERVNMMSIYLLKMFALLARCSDYTASADAVKRVRWRTAVQPSPT